MKQTDRKIESIERHGMHALGRRELVRHLEGGKVTQQQAIRAKCYECNGYYADGKGECAMPDCPLYPFMPYNPNRKRVGKQKTG